MKESILSLIIGFFYLLTVGFLETPQGLEATFGSILLISLLMSKLKVEGIEISRYYQVLVFLSTLISISFAFVTNTAVNCLSSSVVTFVILGLLVVRCQGRVPDQGLYDLARAYLTFLKEVTENLCLKRFSLSNIRLMPSGAVIRAGVISVVPLSLLHILFSTVNEQYALFVHEAIEFFIIHIWAYLFRTLVHWHILFSILAARASEHESIEANARFKELLYFLVPCIGLVALFSTFQADYLLQDLSVWPFQKLSLYVQKGFWELVTVTLIGFGLWGIAYEWGENRKQKTWRILLLIFACELILICIFSLHKIGAHQWFFGLKDSRILATVAVLLALTTFAYCALHLITTFPRSWIIKSPVMVLVFSTTLLSLTNLEHIVTVVHPISYVVDGKRSKDYSYLLTNSYDNYRDWGELMLEAMEQGVSTPTAYYWGAYRPLCEKISSRSGSRTINHLKRHHKRLKRKWPKERPRLKGYFRANIRADGATRWLEANATLVSDFYTFIEQNCQYRR